MARKRNKKTETDKKVEVEATPVASTTARKMKVVDMDKKLAEVKPATGLTAYQQYMREKIANAGK